MSTNFLLNQSLIEAKIIPVYDLNSEHLGFSLTISLPTKLIFIYSIRKVKNRKRSLRRTLRLLKKGGVTIREHSPASVSSKYRSVYLTKDDLTKILGMERKELINEIYETFNTRIGS